MSVKSHQKEATPSVASTRSGAFRHALLKTASGPPIAVEKDLPAPPVLSRPDVGNKSPRQTDDTGHGQGLNGADSLGQKSPRPKQLDASLPQARDLTGASADFDRNFPRERVCANPELHPEGSHVRLHHPGLLKGGDFCDSGVPGQPVPQVIDSKAASSSSSSSTSIMSSEPEVVFATVKRAMTGDDNCLSTVEVTIPKHGGHSHALKVRPAFGLSTFDHPETTQIQHLGISKVRPFDPSQENPVPTDGGVLPPVPDHRHGRLADIPVSKVRPFADEPPQLNRHAGHQSVSKVQPYTDDPDHDASNNQEDRYFAIGSDVSEKVSPPELQSSRGSSMRSRTGTFDYKRTATWLRDLLKNPEHVTKFTEKPSQPKRSSYVSLDNNSPGRSPISRKLTRHSTLGSSKIEDGIFQKTFGELERLLQEALALASEVADHEEDKPPNYSNVPCPAVEELPHQTELRDYFDNNPHQEVVDDYDVRRHGGGMGVWLGIWTWCYVASLAFGFLIGACTIDRLPPAWGFYISIILVAVVLLLSSLCPEVRRSPFRRSVAEVRTGTDISRRVARGEVKMHRVKDGPKWWGQEVYHGVALSFEMLRQPGFAILAVYSGWIYAQIVLIIVLLGSLSSKLYKMRSPYVGLMVAALALGGIAAIPFQKASFLSRARHTQVNTSRMTFDKQMTWTSHLLRRTVFAIGLPAAGIIYAFVSTGPPMHPSAPAIVAGGIGFLSCLAISECNGLVMETFDTSDLQPGMTGRPRGNSDEAARKKKNYSSYPRVTAGFAVCHTFGFIFAAGATALGGMAQRNLGQRWATGVVAGILLILTVLLLLVLVRFKEVLIIPESKSGEMDKWTAARRESLKRRQSMSADEIDDKALFALEEPWRPVIVGNPTDKTRRVNVLELGGMSRFHEIRKRNELVDENAHHNRAALDAGLGALEDQLSDVSTGPAQPAQPGHAALAAKSSKRCKRQQCPLVH
ncbi:hypothetical protein Cob_v000266 [Colletotrichum orbiculare MAFF 240422]|uniref:Polyamine transport protein n=1 Tax=Colletotrichum orbiculare (strain 104-T / ATCC 96160 / CBS 514.97 / LARS 414 / MAFF 240422) TaxID=1213857 RepID=A0A484G769_COLOR|nr:hypothetical protein Cob_v000266 [Colletotrichum orbiculare MAFF 240422]